MSGLLLPAPSMERQLQLSEDVERQLWAVAHTLCTPIEGAHSASAFEHRGPWPVTGSLTLGIDVSTRHARDVQLPQVLTNAILCNKKHLLEITVKKSRGSRNRQTEGGEGRCMPKPWPCLQGGVCPSPFHTQSGPTLTGEAMILCLDHT